MQRYMPTFFQAADASEKWAGMKEDSEDGDWYHREDVDARITELENAAVASALRVKELEKALRRISEGVDDEGCLIGSAEMQVIANSALMGAMSNE